MKNTVVVIYFDAGRSFKYVSELSKRPDGKYVQIFTDDIAQAKYFESEKEANEKISKFVNHHDRIFLTKKVKVEVTTRRHMASGDLEE